MCRVGLITMPFISLLGVMLSAVPAWAQEATGAGVVPDPLPVTFEEADALPGQPTEADALPGSVPGAVYAPPPGMFDADGFDTFLEGLEQETFGAPWIAGGRPVRIGMVSGGPLGRASLRDVFRTEILRLMTDTFEVRFPDQFQRHGDWTLEGVSAEIDALMAAPEVDMVVAVGIIASTALARRGPLPKPGIAAHIIDRAVLGLPESDGTSGVSNLVYISAPNPVIRDLKTFRDLVPFAHLTLLVSEELVRNLPELREQVLEETRELAFEVDVVAVGADAGDALARLSAGTDAVYIAPLLQLDAAGFDKLVDGLIERGLPSFSLLGVDEVERGVLASLHPEAGDERLARRVALYTQRIVLGARPENLPTAFPGGEQLTLNMATARAIGYYPSWAVLAEAVLLNEEPDEVARRLTLRSAVDLALSANRDLVAKGQEVRAGAQDIPGARANLKPQVTVSTQGAVVDNSLANSFQPKRSWGGSVKLEQLIYDERAHANLDVAKQLQRALEEEYAGRELDIVQLAAQGYFNVLRAKTFEQIRRNNLRLSRAHLEMAQVRRAVGTAGPGEVYRWEIELAQSRIAVTDASALRASAQVELNRILNLPQEEPVATEEDGIDDELLTPSREFAERYLDNPRRFAVFRDFLVAEGLERAPELEQLDAGITAQERVELATRRAYYIPSVGLEAELRRDFAFGGKGSVPGGGLQGLLMPPAEEQTRWTVGIGASLPLYAGGGRKAARVQARERVDQVSLEYEAAREKIEGRIRVATHNVRAAFANIRHAEAASEAASQNLDLVVDAYARGVVSVIDLLDAQNAALAAELSAAGAVYEFYIALMEMERASALFVFRLPEHAYRDWLARLEAHFAAAGLD